MSFSSGVKEELSRQISPARHCRIAEIASILCLCGHVSIDENDRCVIKMSMENEAVARKYFTLLEKTFNIKADMITRRGTHPQSAGSSMVLVSSDHEARKILLATKLMDPDGRIGEDMSAVKGRVIQSTCCRRAFLRGAFLAAGSVSDPEKFYHFEIACPSGEKASQIREIIASFGMDARIVLRKKYHVVYVKESSQIADLLNVMEAPQALMDFENIRILKEMRGSVNRKVNCETANINKTVSAAVKQLEDIEYIRDTVGFDSLPENLARIAEERLARPEATLKELGETLDPPVGKSGVNHRLRKLCSLAGQLREDHGAGGGRIRP